MKPVGAIGSHAKEIPTALAMAPGEIGPWCVSNVEDLFIVQATLTAPWISSVPRFAHEGPKLELPGRNPETQSSACHAPSGTFPDLNVNLATKNIKQ